MNPQPKETNPSFFNLLLGNFSDKLRIPLAFSKKHMKSIPKASTLKSRGAGKLFLVSVISNEEGCFFGRGWHKFVEDNQLNVGDFLVFHFLSGSKFEVTIFDSTACEKTLKETGIGHITEMSAQQRNWTEFEATRHQFFKVMVKDFGNQLKIPIKFVENFKEDLPDTICLRGPSGHVWPVTLTKGVDRWVLQGGWTDFVREHGVRETYFLVFRYEGNHVFRVTIFDQTACEKEDCYFIQNQTSVTENVNKIRKGKMEAGESRRDPSDSTSKQKNKYKMYLLSNRRPVSEEEKWRAFQLADAYTKSSTLPSFIKVMKPTQVHHHFVLNCPKTWERDHIPNINNMEIELRVPQLQRKWPVTLKNHKWKFGIAKGWYTFVKDNNLEEDDVCVFELKQGGNNCKCKQNIIFDVSIYRVVDEIVPLTAHN